jgi:hypothetical protein
MLVDRNAALVTEAKFLGFEALGGNALDETTLELAGADEAETLVAVTTNSEVNALAAHLAQDAFGIARAYPALGQPKLGASEVLLERVGGRLAFGRPADVRLWDNLLGEARARIIRVRLDDELSREAMLPRAPGEGSLVDAVLPLARIRDGSAEIITPEQSWRSGDEIVVASRLSEAETRESLLGLWTGKARSSRPD